MTTKLELQIRRLASAAGALTVTKTRGHYKVRGLDWQVTCSGSPTDQHTALLNIARDIQKKTAKRAGLAAHM